MFSALSLSSLSGIGLLLTNQFSQRDGSEAVAKVNQDPEQYDLIFMDIIMPVFDGVSATACIRIASPRVPIVAMTSNIRSEDIATYFHWGMNDVLAKPFTKEGMVRILRKLLPYMLKNPQPVGSGDDMNQQTAGGPPSGYVNASSISGMGGMQAASGLGGVKFETTPIHSPATSSSWHSPGPGQLQHASPNMDNTGGYMQAPVNGGSSQPRGGFPGGPPPGMAIPAMRPMADNIQNDDRPDKRPRLYGPGGQYT